MYRPLWLNRTSDIEEIISEKNDLAPGSSGSSNTTTKTMQKINSSKTLNTKQRHFDCLKKTVYKAMFTWWFQVKITGKNNAAIISHLQILYLASTTTTEAERSLLKLMNLHLSNFVVFIPMQILFFRFWCEYFITRTFEKPVPGSHVQPMYQPHICRFCLQYCSWATRKS